MPYRKDPLINDNYYHVYNRGNNKSPIFYEHENYSFLLRKIKENFNNIAELNTFCFMPNHYHLIVKILDKENFPKIMKKIFISYTKTINKKFNKTGHLFEGRYKYKFIPENNYLLHLSRYIHLNPVRACLVKKTADWRYSSYNIFIQKDVNSLIKHEIITEQISDYEKFVNEYQEEQGIFVKDVLF